MGPVTIAYDAAQLIPQVVDRPSQPGEFLAEFIDDFGQRGLWWRMSLL
jgi:hypothetical protein